jgi:hypothetical protein
MKRFLAVMALSAGAVLLAADKNPKVTGSVGWENPYSHQQVQTTFVANATTSLGNAKGSLVYMDGSITYTIDVKMLKVIGDTAWFAGPVIASNTTDDCCTEGTWVVYKVQDKAEPGIYADKIWGYSTKSSDSTEACTIVTTGGKLNLGNDQLTEAGIQINSGNVQIH